MGKYSDFQDAQKESGETPDTASNFSEAHHTARQDAALDQVRTGESWFSNNDYAVDKVIQRTQENDQAHGDSGK